MPKSGKHLTIESREAIEQGIRDGDPAGRIARRLRVAASTVTREARAHRTVRPKKMSPHERASNRCARRPSCSKSGTACAKCSTKYTNCKDCRTRRCVLTCPDFEQKTCPDTERWPYTCPDGCRRRGGCSFPKCSYRASEAQAAYEATLSRSRSGVCATEAELAAANALVVPLARQGWSFEAIWLVHGAELPFGLRTAYRYQEKGLLGVAAIEMPRKVRHLPRRKAGAPGRPRVDRSGREYADFEALPLPERARAVQGDSVEGLESNSTDVLSLHFLASSLQLYLKKGRGSAADTVAWLDAMESELGSPGAFRAVFPVLLVDRGVEFDDWAGMERSCLAGGEKRCSVFYCDPMKSNQKSQAERNHEQLRRILPKGRSDFDRLSAWDVAVCCSHVNSYPVARLGGRCAIEASEGAVPRGLLEFLGVERVPADEVCLRPWLMAHAVEQ